MKLKIHIGWLLPIVAVSILTGALIEKWNAKFERIGQASLASGTLAKVSAALEVVRIEKGNYPDSIAELRVTAERGDFSEDVLRQITYLKIENGFVAFVGVPQLVYIRPGISPQFK